MLVSRARLLLLALAALPVAAQPTVGAEVSYQPVAGGFAGDDLRFDVPALVVALDGAVPVVRHPALGVHLGATLRLASTGAFDEPPGTPTFQNLGLHATAATTRAGARLQGTAGVVVDLGPDRFDPDSDDDSFFTSDTQHALRLGAGYERRAGPTTVRAGADGFLTLGRRLTLPFTSLEVPPSADSTYKFRLDYGDTVNAYVGVGQRFGPVEVGWTLLYSGRTDTRFESVGLQPEQREPSAQVLSVVPSVTYRAPSGVVVEVAARAAGVWPGEHAVTGLPLVVRHGRVARVPLSLRVGYAL